MSLAMIGLMVPWNDSRLLGGGGAGKKMVLKDVGISPLTLCVHSCFSLRYRPRQGQDPRIESYVDPFHSPLPNLTWVLTDLVNATICVSVLSIGLSSIYAGSRTLTALAETGYAPKVFTYGEFDLLVPDQISDISVYLQLTSLADHFTLAYSSSSADLLHTFPLPKTDPQCVSAGREKVYLLLPSDVHRRC